MANISTRKDCESYTIAYTDEGPGPYSPRQEYPNLTPPETCVIGRSGICDTANIDTCRACYQV